MLYVWTFHGHIEAGPVITGGIFQALLDAFILASVSFLVKETGISLNLISFMGYLFLHIPVLQHVSTQQWIAAYPSSF